MAGLRSIIYTVVSSTPYQAVRRKVARATRPVRQIGIDIDIMFQKDISRPLPDFVADVPVEIAIASRAEVEHQAARLRLPRDGRYREYFLAKYDAGMICFVARSGSSVVAYNWIRLEPGVSDSAFVALRRGEVWCTDAFTAHAWRGNKIHTALLNRMLQFAHERGCTTAYTLTRLRNRGSRKTHHRLGWEMTGRLLHVRIRDRVTRIALTGTAHPLKTAPRDSIPLPDPEFRT